MSTRMKAAILDGYVDEPSCLGVPPYISPYPRYIYGMLKELGIPAYYTTIDHFRRSREAREQFNSADVAVIIAGIAVPGRYLGGKPLSLAELGRLEIKAEKRILVGPIVLETGIRDLQSLGYEVLPFPFERHLFRLLCRIAGVRSEEPSTRDFVNRFAVLGSEVVRQHPEFPNLICEIETYKGCYWRGCSFCIERIHGAPQMRDPKAVIEEIESLYRNGIRHFRLGNQTDFLSYGGDFSKEFPKPNPEFMLAFHREIWRRCPGIKTLHLDNVNPKTIAEYPEESAEVIKTIVMYQSPGNVAAMGLESADERVVEANSLAATPDEVMAAIELVNRYGRYTGYNGLPYFLPGINFVTGLRGETKETFEKNFQFLEEVVEKGLLLRRINIRQVKILKGTPMESFGDRNVRRHKKYFRRFKERVRREIDTEMLKKVVPVGRRITSLRCEVREGRITFARQLATYPLLIGIVGEYDRNTWLDARVVGYGQRSITAVATPLDVNSATLKQLEAIPGIGRSLAARIVAKRPFRSLDELKEVLGIQFKNPELWFSIAL